MQCDVYKNCERVKKEDPYNIEFFSYYTGWSVVLMSIAFLIFLVMYFSNYRCFVFSGVVFAAIANSIGVYISSQILFAYVINFSRDRAGNEIQALDPEFFKYCQQFNLFTHVLPLLIAIIMWIGMKQSALHSSPKAIARGVAFDNKTFGVSVLVLLCMGVGYLATPLVSETDGSKYYFLEKTDILYEEQWIVFFLIVITFVFLGMLFFTINL